MSRILAAVDFSPVSRDVVERAATLAAALDGEVWLVHVAAPDPDFVGYEAGPQTVRDQRASELREEHRKLQMLADTLRERDVPTTALLVQGPTVETLCAEAERIGAELIVLGSHGHGALHTLLLGNVSEGVLRRASCPVLIVPAALARASRPD